MKAYIVKDYDEMSRKAANILAAQIILKSDCVLGLATGSTPIGAYERLVKLYQKGDLDFSEVKTVNLDEYKGLDAENIQSYKYYMNSRLFDKININKNNTFIPDGTIENSIKVCEAYSEVIKRLGGIDLQLLGLGHNGHIGFNEPGPVFDKDIHLVKLAKRTIEANKRFFKSEDDVPREAYTIGIRTIMEAKKILILVSGESKADILEKCFAGPVTPEVPGSILQLHNDVTLIADKAAASKLLENKNF